MVFSKPLANGDRAIALYNSGYTARNISTTTALAGLRRTGAYQIKDLWTGATTETAGGISSSVPAHGTVMLRVSTKATGWETLAPSTSLSVITDAADSSRATVVQAGKSAAVTTTVVDNGKAPLDDVRVTADAPDGWTITATNAADKLKLSTGKSLNTSWKLTSSATAAPGQYRVSVTTSYRWGSKAKLATNTTAISVTVASPPPTGTTDLSALNWASADSGWGPVEKTRATARPVPVTANPSPSTAACLRKASGSTHRAPCCTTSGAPVRP